MRQRILAPCLVVLLGVLSGCDGGFDCPFNRPACCDNTLFGCSPYEIPSGCSCGDYFSRSFYSSEPSARISSIAAQVHQRAVSRTSHGTWRFGGSKLDMSACPFIPQRVTRTVLIREKKRQVQIKIPGYTTLRGKRVGNRVRAKGSFSVALIGCRGALSGDMTLRGSYAASARVSLNAQCQNSQLSCQVTFEGTAQRLD
jgi:hypothetical protein